MEIKFDADYRAKILHMEFKPNCVIRGPEDVLKWRGQWTQALKTWHSPYKACIDCTNLHIEAEGEQLEKYFATMMSFLQGFFLRKAVGYSTKENKSHTLLPFPVLSSLDEANSELGIRTPKNRKAEGFRSSIQFDNHFKQHVVEMSFIEPIILDSAEKIGILKSKLLNNLMLWHSAWSLIIDCSNLKIDSQVHSEMSVLETFLKGFFLKKIVGYSPSTSKETYPFQVFRSRHKAAAALETEGNFSGEEANCQNRKP